MVTKSENYQLNGARGFTIPLKFLKIIATRLESPFTALGRCGCFCAISSNLSLSPVTVHGVPARRHPKKPRRQPGSTFAQLGQG